MQYTEYEYTPILGILSFAQFIDRKIIMKAIDNFLSLKAKMQFSSQFEYVSNSNEPKGNNEQINTIIAFYRV